MGDWHVVVDGSNLASEARSGPSLGQLEEAVSEFLKENPEARVVVVVDATFAHRVPARERPSVEQALLRGDLIAPPAGALGRGDAFLLRIADRLGATVLSNDSFQEFQSLYPWLFDPGRLVGGKPVAGAGWIFTPRLPVRSPRQRQDRLDFALRCLQRARAYRTRPPEGRIAAPSIAEAVRSAGEELLGSSKPWMPPKQPPAALNNSYAFADFVEVHHLGDVVEGEVERFSSHGAYVRTCGILAYLPLAGLGSPPPKRARDVLAKGQHATFRIVAFDPARRGVELTLLDARAEAADSAPGDQVSADLASRQA